MLSHKSGDISKAALLANIEDVRSGIESAALSDTERAARLGILQQLTEFELGRFLLINRGLNGYWTDVIVNRPLDANANSNQLYTNPLEEYLFESSPPFIARREAQQNIHKEVCSMLSPGRAVASIPSGLMSEVLLASGKRFTGVDLFAIDLDPENFDLIRKLYGDRLMGNAMHALQVDARQLDFTDRFDLISSSGLTIYMPNDDDVQELINRFYAALKPNGKLVMTFGATPDEYSPKLAALPRTYALLSAVIGTKWRNLRRSDKMVLMMTNAGFVEVRVIPDTYRLLPTIVGYKQ